MLERLIQVPGHIPSTWARCMWRQEDFAAKTPETLKYKSRASILVPCSPRLSRMTLEQWSNKEWKRCLRRWAWYGAPDFPLVLKSCGRNPEATACLTECGPWVLAMHLLEAKLGPAGERWCHWESEAPARTDAAWSAGGDIWALWKQSPCVACLRRTDPEVKQPDAQ